MALAAVALVAVPEVAFADPVEIRVVIDNQTGQIVTGYPTNLPTDP